MTDEFLAACLGGDLNRMLELLAPSVTAWSDGGGRVKAAIRPIDGADKVARFLLGVLANQPLEGMRVYDVDVNGRPGLLIDAAGQVDSVVVLEIEDGRIGELRILRNPDKLTHLRPGGPV